MSTEDEKKIPIMCLPDTLEEGDIPGGLKPAGGVMNILAKHLGQVPRGGKLGSFNEQELRAVVRAGIELLGGESVGGRWKVQLGVPGVELKVLEQGEAAIPWDLIDPPVRKLVLSILEERRGDDIQRPIDQLSERVERLETQMPPGGVSPSLADRVDQLARGAAEMPESFDFLNKRIDELSAQLEEALAQLAELAESGDSDDGKGEDKPPKKRGRGRPKKSANPLDAPLEG